MPSPDHVRFQRSPDRRNRKVEHERKWQLHGLAVGTCARDAHVCRCARRRAGTAGRHEHHGGCGDLRRAGLVGRRPQHVLYDQPGLTHDALCLVRGAATARRRPALRRRQAAALWLPAKRSLTCQQPGRAAGRVRHRRDRGVGTPRHDMRGVSHRTTRVQAGRRDPRSASRRRACQCGFPGISHRSSCRVARNADAARPARCICPRGCRPRLHGREGDAGQGRLRQMGRAIRRIHGQKPARIAVGAGPARRFRHDLQPRRRARFGRGG